ncbi:hypothetical protein FACS189419_07320 [Planctomycetales bacterium]|nr:hypothetical protein FACS189419_07320 [Planctomycetales bacterium]
MRFIFAVHNHQPVGNFGKLLDSMRDLADAFNASKVLQPLGKKLQKENYAEVAEALKKLDAEKLQQMPNTESKNAGKELQQAAEKMKERQHETLQKAAEQLAKGIKDKNSAEMKEAAEQLAHEIQKQDTRQQVSQQLAASLAKLAEAKANALHGTENGGKQTEISKQSTKNWGMGDAQNPTGGEKTQLAGQRQQQSVKGQIGSQGNSEKEKDGSKETEKPENAESRLDYKNVFPQYQKTAEAVLDTEPVPLGKRLMIRQYFENIRPD